MYQLRQAPGHPPGARGVTWPSLSRRLKQPLLLLAAAVLPMPLPFPPSLLSRLQHVALSPDGWKVAVALANAAVVVFDVEDKAAGPLWEVRACSTSGGPALCSSLPPPCLPGASDPALDERGAVPPEHATPPLLPP